MIKTQNINILKKFRTGEYSESISLWAAELKKNALNKIYPDLALAKEHLEKNPENDESKATYINKLTALQSCFKISITTKFRHPSEDKKPQSPISGMKETADGDIVVSDDFNHQIQVYDQEYQLKFSFGQKGKNHGEFYYPKGIDIDLEGNIYVADSWNHRIQKFTKDGKYMSSFGIYGSGPSQFNELVSIAINHEDQLLVVDRCNHRIQWLDREGNYLGAIGGRGRIIEEDLAGLYGTPPEKFSHPALEFPSDIALDSKNDVYIVDSHNHRILKFDSNGKFILSFGKQGKEHGEFLYPQSIAIGQFDNIFISDLNNNRIQLFSPVGEHYYSFSGNGTNEKTESPTVLACGKGDTLLAGFAFSPKVLAFNYCPISPKERNCLKIEFSKSSANSLFLAGNFYRRNQNYADAIKKYEEALSIISTGSEEIIPQLPLNYLYSIQKNQYEGFSSHLLNYYDKRLSLLYSNILDVYQKRKDIAGKLIDPILNEEKKVIDGILASGEIDKNLYELNHTERALNRDTKKIFLELKKIQAYQTEMFLLLIPKILLKQNNNELKDLIQISLSNFFQLLDILNRFLEDHDIENSKCFEELQKANNAPFNLKVFQLAFFLTGTSNDFIQFSLPILRSLLHFLTQLSMQLGASKTHSNIDLLASLVQDNHIIKSGKVLYKLRYDLIGILLLKESFQILLSLFKPIREEIISRDIDIRSFEKNSLLTKDSFNFEKDLIELLLVEEIGIEATEKGLRVGLLCFSDSDMESFRSQIKINDEKNYTDLLNKLKSSINQLSSEKRGLDQTLLKHESNLQSIHPGDQSSRLRVIYDHNLINAQSAYGNKLILEHLFLYRVVSFKRCLFLLMESELKKEAKDEAGIKEIYLKIDTFCNEINEILNEIKSNKKQIRIDKGLWLNNINNILNASQIDKAKEIEASNKLFQLNKDIQSLNIFENEYASILILQNKVKDYIIKKDQAEAKSTTTPDYLHLNHNLQFGSMGSNDGQFHLPSLLCCNKNGDIYVSDTDNHRIQRFDSDGNHLLTFGSYGDFKGSFKRPHGILCDEHNNIFVCDLLNHRIQKFNSEGNHIMSFGKHGDKERYFDKPIGICQDPGGFLYITEVGNHRIQKFTVDGQFILSFGKKGEDNGNFNQPVTSCFYNDMILVGEMTSDRIQIFDTKGAFVKSFKYSNGTIPKLQGTANISVDNEGRFFISEFWNNRMYVFSKDLHLITSIGSTENYKTFFNGLSGVTFAGNYVFLCDHFNHRIHRFNN